jgi:predicted DNA-binding protein
MADKKNLCAMIPADLHARVRQEQEQSGKTLSEYVEQLIQNYYNMKENKKMTGDMRTMAIQLPEELFERLKAYLKKNNLKQKQFIIGLIEDALEEDEESTIAQAESEGSSETEDPDEPDEDTDEE